MRAFSATLAALALSGCIAEGFGRVRGTIISDAAPGPGPVASVRVVARGSLQGLEQDHPNAPVSRTDGTYLASYGWGGMVPFFYSGPPEELFVAFLADGRAACTVALDLRAGPNSFACGPEPRCIQLDVSFLAPTPGTPEGPACRVVTSAAPARVVR